MVVRRRLPALVLGVIMVVWIWVMRRRRWKNLHFLTVLVRVVGWMLDVLVVVRLLLVVVCVCDESLVVGRLCSGHPVTGGLRFWTVFGLVGAVFAVEEAVESARRLRTPPTPTASSVSAALGGYSWRRGASVAGCWLAMLCTCC